MTDAPLTEKWDDIVLPFQLDRSDIRGRVARLDGVLDQILAQHQYPLEVSSQVAEAALLTALIGQTIDLRWKLSLQIRGNGPLRIVATDYYGPTEDGDPARIRAWASFDEERLEQTEGSAFDKIGKGMFAILIDQGNGTQPYQGITPLAGGSLSACAETYFAQSEQLPTRFHTVAALATAPGGAEGWRAGGLMIQHLPKASPSVTGEGGSGEGGLLAANDVLDDDAEENWNRAVILMDSAEEIEMIGPHVSQTQLLTRLFHEEEPRIYAPQPIEFGCTCGEDKVRNTMSMYSAKDIAHMTTDDGKVTADCQFCGAHYEMDPSTLGFDAPKEG